MTLPCPRCGAPLEPPATDAGPVTVCGECGLAMATEYVRETVELGTWHAWAGRRLTWLHDRMLAGDQPPDTAAPAGPPGVAAGAAPARHPASAGSLLLAVGAFLLVAAGIAFLAFTWDLLGPFGQISVLLALGAACLAATARLVTRLRGTANALGVVGALLVVIASLGTRTLGPDLVGESVSLVMAVLIAGGLCAAAVWLRPRTAPVGELSGAVGALTVVGLLATPGDAVPLGDHWTWWAALVCGGGGVVLVLLADRAGLRSWPWVGAWFLLLASAAFAATVLDAAGETVVSDVDSAVVAGAFVVAAVALSGALRLLPHRAAVTSATLATWSLALVVSWTSAVSDPPVRPWSAAVLLAAGAIALLPMVFALRGTWLRGAVSLLGAASLGAAVGLLVAPWVDPWEDYLTATGWADAAWPAWRGVVAGLALVAVLVASVLLAPLVSQRRDDSPEGWVDAAPLLPAAATLFTWVVASTSDLGDATQGGASLADPYAPVPTPDSFQHGVAVALAILAAGLLTVTLLRRVPAWSAWPAGALGVAAGLLELSTRDVSERVRPEVWGLALAAPTLAVAVSWWWLRRPRPTPTWQTVGPVLTLAVLPSTLALLDDTTSRWWYGEDPGTTYQVRTVALLAIGVVAAVVGGWRRWSGLFFPGLALTVVVVAIQLVELGRFLPQWVSFAVAGAVLIAAGARWEWVRDRGRAGTAWVRALR